MAGGRGCCITFELNECRAAARPPGLLIGGGIPGIGMAGATGATGMGSSLTCFILSRLMKLTSCCSVCPVAVQFAQSCETLMASITTFLVFQVAAFCVANHAVSQLCPCVVSLSFLSNVLSLPH